MNAPSGIEEILVCPVPAGEYPIGDDALEHSRPLHQVWLSAFSITLGCVSNRLFATFIRNDGYADSSYWTQAGWRWQRVQQKTEPAFWHDPRFNQPEQPVVGVCWYEAMAFTRWLRERTRIAWRLPTEVEWEAAARGTASTTRFTPPEMINTTAHGLGKPWAAVGQGGIAWCGAQNMLGNVWEWTSSRWGRSWQTLEYAYPYNTLDERENINDAYARVIRGGSWFDDPAEARATVRGRYLPGSRASNIGFRLARHV